MSKKSKRKKSELDGVCLHCIFMKAHRDKWPDWKPEGDEEGEVAFQDLVHSAIKIAVNVFAYLGEKDQMKFMQSVMDKTSKLDEGRAVISNLLEQLKPRGPTEH
jgi:hypothetical protein